MEKSFSPIQAYISLILSIMQNEPGISRHALAARTGIRLPTIINIITMLRRKGAVTEKKVFEKRRGRRSLSLFINPSYKCSVGIEITGGELLLVAVQYGGTTQEIQKINFRLESLRNIIKILKKFTLRISAAGPDNFCGVAFAFPGFFDTHHNRWRSSIPGVPEIAEAAVGLCRKMKWSFRMEKTFHTIALSASRKYPDETTALIELNDGIGCCVIHKNGVYESQGGCEGEAGHLPVPGNQEKCGCGRIGCVETILGVPSIIESVKKLYRSHSGRTLCIPANRKIDSIDFSFIVNTYREGDKLIRSFIQKRLLSLKYVLEPLILLQNPDRILLTGALTHFEPALIQFLDSFFAERAGDSLPSMRKTPIEIYPCPPGEMARIAAAGLFSNPAMP